MNTATEGIQETICNSCRFIPITHLGQDVAEPIVGWTAFFAERGVEVVEDDLGRASVPRQVLADLLAEARDREVREEARQAEQIAAASGDLVSVGVPALDGDASAFESMVSTPSFVSADDEFRRVPRPRFLERLLDEGRQGDQE